MIGRVVSDVVASEQVVVGDEHEEARNAPDLKPVSVVNAREKIILTVVVKKIVISEEITTAAANSCTAL